MFEVVEERRKKEGELCRYLADKGGVKRERAGWRGIGGV